MLSFFVLLPVSLFTLVLALEPGWLPKYREVCYNGERQSPINIASSEIQIANQTSFVTLVNYNTTIPNLLKVNDQFYGTVILYHDGLPPQVSAIVRRRDDGSTAEYDLHSVHFRWRCTEHAFDDQHYAMEIQFLHYNRAYGTLHGAMTEKDGILGIAVLFKLEDRDNAAIDGVLNIMKEALTSVKWSDLLSTNASSLENFDLHHYNGSTTLKPCLETVAWYVLPTVNYVSQRQIEHFQSIHSPPVTCNCRPIQSLNGRRVYRVHGGLGIENQAGYDLNLYDIE